MSDIKQQFQEFKDYLNNKTDERELVIKASREITILCKRSIFLLHRTSSENQYSIITEAKAKLEDIKDKFYKLRGLGADSSNRRSWRPSLEEYIEAILFWNYLTNSDLLSFDDFITQYFTLPGCDDPILPVYPEDYIGGLSDFTGELMRYAIFVLGKGKFETACFINDSLQEIERMTSGMRNKKALSKMIGKLDQISSNTRKTENAYCKITMLKSEFSEEDFLSLIPDIDIS